MRDFFTERQKRIPNYAESVLSLRSKLELVKDKFPFTDRDTHTRFLKDEFSRLIFSQEELKQQITGAVQDYV